MPTFANQPVRLCSQWVPNWIVHREVSERVDVNMATRRAFLTLTAGLGLGGVAGRLTRLAQMRPAADSSALTSLQLAGQRVIRSYPGLTPPKRLLNDITAGRTAGVIFFGENISSLSQIAGVIAQLRQAQAQSPIQAPLLLMTDQEGGLVRRLPGEPVQSARQIGQSANPAARAPAPGLARTLRHWA